MSPFLRRAEEILETAVFGCEELAIVIGRGGEVRMLNPAGWSLAALRIEFGAESVYKVERVGQKVRVEGWDGSRTCRLERAGQSPGLHHALDGSGVDLRGEHTFQKHGAIPMGGFVVGHLDGDDLAVLGHPNSTDQAKDRGIIGSLDCNPNQLVA